MMENIITDVNQLTDNDIIYLRELPGLLKQSTAEKRKVGAVIGYHDSDVDWVISSGFNHQFDSLSTSSCEDENGETYGCVIHSEEQAIIDYLQKKHTIPVFQHENIAIYVTYSPCMNCSKLIVHSGIKKLFYVEKHPVNFDQGVLSPLDFLNQKGVSVNRISMELYNLVTTG